MWQNALNLGPFKLNIYGFLIGVGIALGYLLILRRSKAYKIKKSEIDSPLLLLPLFLAGLFARIYHVLDYWDYYSTDIGQIPQIWNGGIGIIGGLVGFVLGTFLFSKIKNLSFLTVMDIFAPSVALAQSIGRLGNYFNKEGFGPPTNLPWGVYIPPDSRPEIFSQFTHFHPTFFYESIISLTIFVILLTLSKKLKHNGQLFFLYIGLYGGTRFLLEFLRVDTWTIGTIKVAQLVSLVLIFISILLFKLLSKRLDSR